MGFGQGAWSNHLIPFDSQTAFAAYEAVRDRLPLMPPGTYPWPQQLHNLDDLADRFDAFLLDAFGVLNIGKMAIPDVPDRVRSLQATGKPVLVLTNSASRPITSLLFDFAQMNYAFSRDTVITSRLALLSDLPSDQGHRWGVMAQPDMQRTDCEALDMTILGDDPAAYATADGFLLLGSASWTEHQQVLLERALAECPRPVLAGNPDLVAPRETEFTLQPGYFAHRLADRSGVRPVFYGKPFGNIFAIALSRLPAEIAADRILMVGDSLHTDILGARAAGIASALIAGCGFFAGQDAGAAIRQSGIYPDFFLEHP